MNSRIIRTGLAFASTSALVTIALPAIAHAATSTPSPTSSASASASPSPTPTSSASSAAAQSGSEITSLPARASLTGGQTSAQFVTVKLLVPTGANCAEDFKASPVGQSQAISVPSNPDCTTAGFAKWTVTAKATTSKANVVVKFIGPNAAGKSRTIGTLTIKVNTGAKPAKPTKSATPTTTPTSSATPSASSSATAAKPGKPSKAPKA